MVCRVAPFPRPLQQLPHPPPHPYPCCSQMEAARMLAFTEEEFAKILEAGS
jgi:hypothetical protein